MKYASSRNHCTIHSGKFGQGGELLGARRWRPAYHRPYLLLPLVATLCLLGSVAARAQTWTSVRSLNTPVSEFAASTGTNGLIYAIGGEDGAGNHIATVEVYNPTLNVWSAAASLNIARHNLAAATGRDGRIYAIGGQDSQGNETSSVEAYDPSTDTWTPVAPMNTARFDLAAAVGDDGRIYAIGGAEESKGALAGVEAYDPATNTWTNVAPMSVARSVLAAVTGADGRIYAIGGAKALNSVYASVEAYDPSTNAWTKVAPLNVGRAFAAAATGPDGRIYAIGGGVVTGNETVSGALASVEAYSLRTNTWTKVASLNVARAALAATAGPDGRIFAIGGTAGPQVSNVLAKVEVYGAAGAFGLTGISPGSVTAGSGATTITLTGTSFAAGAAANWNGAALATAFVSATRLTALVPASALTSAGIFNVTVTNPAPSGTTSGAVAFSVTNPAPVLTGVSPNSAPAGSAMLTASATGQSFASTSVVLWDATALTTTFVSATSLSFVIPKSDLAAAGAHKVTVKTPTPGGGVSAAVTFTVFNNPKPTLTTISPSSATVGASALTVTATGTGFAAASVAQLDGTALATTVGSATSLTFVVPSASLASAGTHKITVKTPAPGGGVTSALTFAVNNTPPTVTSLTPNSASAGAPATTITVAGSGFASGAQVLWNGAGLATTFVSGAALKVVVPAADLAVAGTFNVAVKNPAPGGGTSATLPFSVSNPAPTLTSISPASALTGSAAVTVTATGKGFMKTSAAQWDGASLTTTYKSATTVTFVVPIGDLAAVGTHSITIVNPTPGGGTSGAVTFSVNNPSPTLSSISLTSALTGSPDLSLTATGKGFTASSVVQWDGSSLTTTYVSATSLSFVIPSGDVVSAGTHKVTVFTANPGGGASNALTFTVSVPKPVTITKQWLQGTWVKIVNQRLSAPDKITVSGFYINLYWNNPSSVENCGIVSYAADWSDIMIAKIVGSSGVLLGDWTLSAQDNNTLTFSGGGGYLWNAQYARSK